MQLFSGGTGTGPMRADDRVTGLNRLKPYIPNAITIARAVLGVLVVMMMELTIRFTAATWFDGRWLTIGVIYGVAAFSDVFDGQLARRWNVTSAFGRIADTATDKILNILVLMSFMGKAAVPLWVVATVFVREIVVMTIRSAFEARTIPFPADGWGKLKMVLQSSGIGLIFIAKSFLGTFALAYTLTFWTAIAIIVAPAILSGVHYIVKGIALNRATPLN
ncbi:MAG: CDP-alcohol phosphatidyltransferase family protein [bacterium]|nr:CDP-alcohol phosphatidyltransferase family protein [bacterium]